MRNASYKDVAGRLMQELNEEDLDGEVIIAISRTRNSKTSKGECTMH
jgi:hypothetical protein